jgi:hypothetical protein
MIVILIKNNHYCCGCIIHVGRVRAGLALRDKASEQQGEEVTGKLAAGPKRC